jgi:hypothetical protein
MPSKDEKPVPRILQPPRESDPQQQKSGSNDSQPEAAGNQ